MGAMLMALSNISDAVAVSFYAGFKKKNVPFLCENKIKNAFG